MSQMESRKERKRNDSEGPAFAFNLCLDDKSAEIGQYGFTSSKPALKRERTIRRLPWGPLWPSRLRSAPI